MTREEYLEQRADLLAQAQQMVDSGDVSGAEGITEQVKELDANYEAEATARANITALAGAAPHKNIVGVGAPVSGSVIESVGGEQETADDVFASMDYRRAFMAKVVKGTEIPAQFRNEAAKTTDNGAVIPTTVMDRIIDRIEKTGNILALVTRTSYPGGVSIPVSKVKPVAEWVGEGKGSSDNKPSTGTVDFKFHKLRCKIPVTLEMDTMAIDAFEAYISKAIADAIVRALEEAIIKGTGSGQPKGILTENAPEGQNVDVEADDDITYQTLTEAEGALPEEYETEAVWLMSKKTFMKCVGMVDSQNRPIVTTTIGLNGKPEYAIIGRKVETTQHIEADGEKETDTKIAAIFRMSDYVLNSNLETTVTKYEDHDTDDQVTKAVTIADGKVIDVNSLVTITRKAKA